MMLWDEWEWKPEMHQSLEMTKPRKHTMGAWAWAWSTEAKQWATPVTHFYQPCPKHHQFNQ